MGLAGAVEPLFDPAVAEPVTAVSLTAPGHEHAIRANPQGILDERRRKHARAEKRQDRGVAGAERGGVGCAFATEDDDLRLPAKRADGSLEAQPERAHR